MARSGRTAALLWSTVLIAPAAGCNAPPPARLFGAPTTIDADDFPVVLETWTRSERVYEGLENKLFVSATFHAPDLRRAFALAFPDIYGRGGEITKRELVELTGDVEQYHSFFVAAYTPSVKWNDFAKDDSIWRLSLINDRGVGVDAAQVISIKIDENLRAVYPYIGRFDKAYLVRFPLADPVQAILIEPSTTAFTLRIASSLGVAALRWDLIPAEATTR